MSSREKSIQELAMESAKGMIGLTFEQFRGQVEPQGWTVRMRKVDGKSLIGTCDFRNNRINVDVENGIVTSIGGIG